MARGPYIPFIPKGKPTTCRCMKCGKEMPWDGDEGGHDDRHPHPTCNPCSNSESGSDWAWQWPYRYHDTRTLWNIWNGKSQFGDRTAFTPEQWAKHLDNLLLTAENFNPDQRIRLYALRLAGAILFNLEMKRLVPVLSSRRLGPRSKTSKKRQRSRSRKST